MIDLTVSIVLYKNDRSIVERAIDSLYATTLDFKLYLIDNSPTDELKMLKKNARTEYTFCNANLGFGKAHNIALKKAVGESKFHLVLNPDVSFGPGVVEKLSKKMEERPDIGLLLPKILNDDFEVQFGCKRLPTPLHLMIRRSGLRLLAKYFEDELSLYEMKDKDYNVSFEAPSMSGCFMFFRTDAIKKIGFFDERYFMYMEDIDISRRVLKAYKNVYYPEVHIHHGHARESYKFNKLLFVHIMSAIKYFNKWGWIFDRERKDINNSI